MKILSINKFNQQLAINFLSSINEIFDVNNDVVLNGCMALDNEDIGGMIAFEKFNNIGWLRYFVCKNVVETGTKDLFESLVNKALSKGINQLITLVVKPEAISIYKTLGFHEVDKQKVFIGETNILDTKFKNANVYVYDVIFTLNKNKEVQE